MSLLDLSDVVADLSDEDALTVTRASSAPSYTNGRLDTPTTTTFTIAASVQPANSRDLERLPEGSRISDARAVFTTTELRTLGPTQSPDLVTIAGEAYEVQAVQLWANIGNYWRAVALKTGN